MTRPAVQLIASFIQNTKRAIALVCRDWFRFSSELLYQHIVIQRFTQLKFLVHTLEDSHLNASKRGSVALGWWISHVKLFTMDNESTSRLASNESVTGYLRRLLSHCPRLEVFIDAAPYGFDEHPKIVLPPLFRNSSTTQISLRSLEWVFGGPMLDDLAANSHVTNSIRSLRCTSIHDRRLPSARGGPLSFPYLVSLDLFLSRQNHTHWRLLAETCIFPSLTNLTIRTPTAAGTILGIDAMRSLKAFLAVNGSRLRLLDLKVNPGDGSPISHHHLGEEAAHIFSVPPILALCPNITDLIISARWIAAHTGTPNGSTTSSPFFVRRHENLTRIGLRDTSPTADGFSTSVASGACQYCTRPSIMMPPPVTPAGRGEYAGQQGSGVQVDLIMSHRHCTIDRHLRALLRGFFPRTATSGFLPPFLANDPHQEVEKRFPELHAIQLLDSESTMFDLGEMARCDQWRTCWCTPGEMRIEASFWAAWAERCADRGVQLLDRYEHRVPLVRDEMAGRDQALSDTPVEMDLDKELVESMVVNSQPGFARAIRRPTFEDCAIEAPILVRLAGWFSERGVIGVTRK